MVFVQMGDNHRIHVDNFFLRHRKMHERIAFLAVHRAFKTWPGVSIRKHRIDKETNAAIDDMERRVAYLRYIHTALRCGGNLRACRKGTGDKRSAR